MSEQIFSALEGTERRSLGDVGRDGYSRAEPPVESNSSVDHENRSGLNSVFDSTEVAELEALGHESKDENDIDDDVTIIDLDDNGEQDGPTSRQGNTGRAWMLQDGQWWDLSQFTHTVNEDRQRAIIRGEILRIQKANFCHLMILCLVPTSLLLIVLVSALSTNGLCKDTPAALQCDQEERIFVNAFTTRCICNSIGV